MLEDSIRQRLEALPTEEKTKAIPGIKSLIEEAKAKMEEISAPIDKRIARLWNHRYEQTEALLGVILPPAEAAAWTREARRRGLAAAAALEQKRAESKDLEFYRGILEDLEEILRLLSD